MIDGLPNSRNIPQILTQKDEDIKRSIYNELQISNAEPIDSAGPNRLVPKGLIYNEASGKLFEYLKSKGIRFYLDSERKTEKGYSNRTGKYIFLGLKTPRSYTKNMGIGDSFDEDAKTQIIFLHEMCHHLTWELLTNNQYFQKLKFMCTSLRKQRPKNGATKLADMEFYHSMGLDIQATEDCVELLRIYFMCRNNESACFECIKNKLNIQDDTACKKMFELLYEAILYKFPTW